jgi:hypothetical protein
MPLSNKQLDDLLSRGKLAASVTVPWVLFSTLCSQAMLNGAKEPARILMPTDRIKELLSDPHNADIAALSIETLRKLCWQAMSKPDSFDQ